MRGATLVAAAVAVAMLVAAGMAVSLIAAPPAELTRPAPQNAAAAESAAPKLGRPIWRLDLRPQGYPLPEWGGTTAPSERDKIAFGSNDEIVVLGDTHSFPKPSRVEAYVIATATGKVTARAAWTVALRPHLFATSAGQYAVLTTDGTVLHAGGLGREVARSPGTLSMASPDGLSLLVEAPESAPGRAIKRLFDADTLRPNGAVFINRDIESIARTGAAWVGHPGGSSAATVLVEDGMRSVTPRDTACAEVHPGFLGEQVMMILGCGRMEVVRLDGPALLEATVGAATALAAVARDGGRFAIIEADWIWRDVPRLRGETLRIFDLGTNAELWVVALTALRGSDFPASSGAALSPDGSLLAVNTLGRVSLYRLPSKLAPGADKPASK